MWEFLTEPDGERAGRCSITGLMKVGQGLDGLGRICADPIPDPPNLCPKLLILNAFPGRRRWLRAACLGEIAGAVVQLELLLLQSRIYNLDLDLPV